MARDGVRNDESESCCEGRRRTSLELWIHSPDLLIDDTESELESSGDLGNESR